MEFLTRLYIQLFHTNSLVVPARARRGAGILEYAILALVAVLLFGVIVVALRGTGDGGDGVIGQLISRVRTALGIN